MSAALDSSVSVSTEVMASTFQVLVPGIEEASLATIAASKFIWRCGSVVDIGRSIAHRFMITLS